MIKFIVVHKDDRDVIYTRPFPGADGWHDICDSISAKEHLDSCPTKYFIHETEQDAQTWIKNVGLYDVTVEPLEMGINLEGILHES